MDNAIKLDRNKIVIKLSELGDIKINKVIKRLKELVYNNKVDVLYVISDLPDNDRDEFYSFRDFVGKLKEKFNILLMLKTGYFPNTQFYDSVFALGVDSLILSISKDDEDSSGFEETLRYITSLWPSGAIFTDLYSLEYSAEEILEKITAYAKMKVIPKVMKVEDCGLNKDKFCIRSFILNNLKENGVSLKWVMNFELCGVIQQNGGRKGRSKRRLAGKFALELASLRRKLMVKDVRSSLDSASL